ncbi:MAG: NAD(P)H-hydrate dehydratase [Clostridia bacterium]|nr:NAD(P)H-hydrate dehydratase [Clostridia bacterium]
MEKVLTNSQMRAADGYTINELKIPSQTLMLRAGEAIAEEVEKTANRLGTKNVLVVCGTGNNGGDGYVCARKLKERGFEVAVYSAEGKLSDDCAREAEKYTGGFTREISGGIIVDSLFGTGLTRDVKGQFADIIGKINSSGTYVISADIPSGLCGDSGKVLGCAVKANLTVAVAEYKAGHFLGDGIDLCGKVVKKDIGITCPKDSYAHIFNDSDIKAFYPGRKRNTNKGSYGSANLIAGSSKYIGAAALAAEAALKSGCGYVKLTSCEEVKNALVSEFPQVIFDDVDLTSGAIAIGMGSGISEELYGKIDSLLKNYSGTLIIDADGLNTISKFGINILINKSCRVILTPHPKEFSRLTGLTVDEILSDPVTVAKAFAKKYGVILLLKGAASIITDGEKIVINTKGSTALSKGGSGDMLSGYLCGCIARGLNPFDGVVCAAYTLGITAEEVSEQKTDYCATARDIINNIHRAVLRLTR